MIDLVLFCARLNSFLDSVLHSSSRSQGLAQFVFLLSSDYQFSQLFQVGVYVKEVEYFQTSKI